MSKIAESWRSTPDSFTLATRARTVGSSTPRRSASTANGRASSGKSHWTAFSSSRSRSSNSSAFVTGPAPSLDRPVPCSRTDVPCSTLGSGCAADSARRRAEPDAHLDAPACPGAGPITTVRPGSRLLHERGHVADRLDRAAVDRLDEIARRARRRARPARCSAMLDDHRPERGVDAARRPASRAAATPVASSWRATPTATSIETAYVVALPLTWPRTMPATDPDASTSAPPTTAGVARGVGLEQAARGRAEVAHDHRVVRRGHAAAHPRRLRPGAGAPSSQTDAPVAGA